MAQILVFGDSITYGAWDKEGGWVQRLRKLLDKQNLSNSDNFYYLVYNLSIDGDTTNGLLKRFESETSPRMWEGEKTIIVFSIGINDSCFIQTKNIFMISKEKFEENIKKLINLAQKFSSNIVFIGLTPVEEIKVTPLPWSKTGKSYKNEYIKEYNKIIKSVCKENNVYFIEIFEQLTRIDYKNLLEDGAHPNTQGHKKIFEIVKDFLIKNKII
ncbi:MAG: GDSL-type esterase/lipase family protein [Minisyncoccales bacterium]